MHNTDHQPSPKDAGHHTPARTGPDFVAEPRTLVIEDKSLKGGFVQIPRVILHARNLSRHAKILYAILLSYAWQEEECFPGYARLCQDLQASENSVRLYMRELEKAHLLRQRRRGLGKTNLYIIPDLRTAKIEVQEPQPLRTSRSEVLDAQDSPVPDPQDSRDLMEVETGEVETGEQDFDLSKLRKVKTGTGEVAAQPYPPSPSARRAGSEQAMDEGFTTPAQVLRAREASSEEAAAIQADPSGPGYKAGGSRPEMDTEEWARLQFHMGQFRKEFGDQASLRSSTTRAYNLFVRSGLSIEAFTERLFRARVVTQEHTASITAHGTDADSRSTRKTKIPYFFSVLEDVLDLLPPEERARREALRATALSRLEQRKAEEHERSTPGTSSRGQEQGTNGSGRRPDREGPYGQWIKS